MISLFLAAIFFSYFIMTDSNYPGQRKANFRALRAGEARRIGAATESPLTR